MAAKKAKAKKTGTAVAVVKGGAALAPTDSRNIMAMIGAASKDKSVDVGKMERLVELYERVTKNEAKQAFAESMVKLKPNLPIIERRGRIIVRAKDPRTGERTGAVTQDTPFAKWEDIDEALTPILKDYGFVLTFRSGNTDDGRLKVTAVLTHERGHVEETTMALPFDTTGSKNNVQAIGSSASYGKRYTAIMILNIRTKGEDDDGNAGGFDQSEPQIDVVSQEEADELKASLASAGVAPDKFFQAFSITKVEQLPKMRLQEARDRIKQFVNKGFQKPKTGMAELPG